MATTNHTPNFNLPQWTADDMVGVMANLNPAFLTIDTKLNEAVVNAENASTTASAANKTAADVSKLVSEVDTDVTTLQADVLTLQNLVNAISERIKQIDTWNNVTLNPNNDYITVNYINMQLRSDKNFMSVYGFAEMKKVKFTGGEVLFNMTNYKPTTQRDIVNFCFVRYGIEGKAVDVPLRCRINTDGSIVVVNPYDFTTSSSIPLLTTQLMLNTSDWYK